MPSTFGKAILSAGYLLLMHKGTADTIEYHYCSSSNTIPNELAN